MPSNPSSRSAGSALPVALDEVNRTFDGTRRVLRDVSLQIAPGEIVALIGASGSGKSTLLRQVGGLDRPDSGSVTIDGKPLAGVDQRSAIAFQEPRLLPWRTVARNIEVGLPRGTARAAGRARVAELLELVQLTDAAHLRPRQISGGMAQRTSLARALARDPGVLLLDEPFGALDALTRLTMQDLLLDIHAVEPATILFVTHDVDEALYLADRVVLLGVESGYPPNSGAIIRSVIPVPGRRPRDRSSNALAHLRANLLEGLGVSTHHPAHTF
ncbi:ABC transporter ATP-binding protein [soil metagenome]